MDDSRIKHLELIQAAIGRISGHSFAAKGLAITAAAAIVSFAADEKKSTLLVAGAVLVLVFWGLDAWYLRCERMFRKMYDAERQREGPSDFKISPEEYRDAVPNWLCTACSKTVIWVYLPPTVLLLTGAMFL
jgi:hypothetical protein